ncbi:AI-2E family transporter [Salinadaptatus halalkaliphilus]|uniref:AI-2E family transporter n=1 Tax=Salinadaptatus halalkaliphilus TaxID=2419781 RepID=A0A4S3TJA6_9EURY|nr:AI-2E family transporter [Salinadaptatus halalkaliphilus]THE63313.1 AI-2E family transporter [Salinadaptatus halalkaliphilus]
MADRPAIRGRLAERPGLTALALVSAGLGALVILPYLQYVLLGVVLAYILTPLQRRLERYVGSMVAAMTLVVVAILAILLPVAYVLLIALEEALEVLTAIQEGDLGIETIESYLESTGYAVDIVETYETYQEPIGTAAQELATTTLELVSALPQILIGLTVTLFVLFALLRDGDRLVAWTRTVLPIRDELQDELLAELDQLMWASVVGNVAVAAIQAILLGIGLELLGVPAVVFLTVATFVLALLPLVGAFGVWVPVSIYLLVLGRPVAALLLVAYGSLVSASDTYLRPALIGRTSAFNAAIIVVGIFGGLVVFGAVGLFIGPVVLGGAKIILDVAARERRAGPADDLDDAETLESDEMAADPAVDTDPETGISPEDGAESESDETAVSDEDATGSVSDGATETGTEPTSDDESGQSG